MKSKFILLIVLIGVSLLFGLPHLLVPVILGGDKYSPLGGGSGPQSAITMEQVYTYVPEVQEILEGRWIVHDTQLVEYKSAPSPFIGETVPAYLMAALSIVSGSVADAFLLADFLFPPLTFLLVYFLGKQLSLSRHLALAASLTVLIATDLISLVPYPKPVWDMLIGLLRKDDFLFFSRNFHPQISFLLLVLTVLFIIRALKNLKPKEAIIAGVAVGFQFYTYLFNWTSLALSLMLISIWTLLTNRMSLLRQLIIVGVSALIIGFPYFMTMSQFRVLPSAANFFEKSSLPPRTFLPITARYVLLIVASLIIIRKKSLALIIISALVVSPILLTEIAVLILGQDLEGKHWIRRVIMPFSILIAASVLQATREKFAGRYKRKTLDKFFQFGYGIVIILVLQYGLRVQIAASKRYAPSYTVVPEKQQALNWIRDHVGRDETTASLDTGFIAEIPALSQANNAIPITIRSVASTDESLDRFLRIAAIYRVSPEAVADLLTQEGFISRVFYFTAIDEGKVFHLSPRHLELILLQYRNILENENVSTFPYRLDYLIVGPLERKVMNTNFSDSFYFRTVFRNGRYQLLRVNDE